MAIDELINRGILFELGEAQTGPVWMSPLTFDFLLSQWHQDRRLQRKVADALASALPEHEGLFVHLPEERAVALLRGKARSLAREGEREKAMRLVRVALDRTPRDPGLRFLEGRLEYTSGRFAKGIKRMETAASVAAVGDLDLDDHLFLIDGQIQHGGALGEKCALEALEKLITTESNLDQRWFEEYARLALRLRDYGSFRAVLAQLSDVTNTCNLMRALVPYVDATLAASCGHSLVATLRRAAASDDVSESERSAFRLAARDVQQVIDRLDKL